MKNHKFFFGVVVTFVVIGVFFLFFFGVIKPRFVANVRAVSMVHVVEESVVGAKVDGGLVAHYVQRAHVQSSLVGDRIVRQVVAADVLVNNVHDNSPVLVS